MLLSELEQGTVDWGPNFDGTLEEPKLMPSRLPHVLLNGASGIAVGMATDIPPHNVGEIVGACIRLLDDPKLADDELYEADPRPRLPDRRRDHHLRARRSGGSTRPARARCACAPSFEVEDGDVVITALPYQVSGSKVMTQIAAQMPGEEAARWSRTCATSPITRTRPAW